MTWQNGHLGGICCKCGGLMKKRTGKYGEFYGCSNYPRCNHTANVNIDGELEEKPSKTVREARIKAHKYFDRLWRQKRNHHRKHNGPVFRSRHEAYRWLRRIMQLPPEEAHMKQMNEEQCAKVVYESKMLLYNDFRARNCRVVINLFGIKIKKAMTFEQKRGM